MWGRGRAVGRDHCTGDPPRPAAPRRAAGHPTPSDASALRHKALIQHRRGPAELKSALLRAHYNYVFISRCAFFSLIKIYNNNIDIC